MLGTGSTKKHVIQSLVLSRLDCHPTVWSKAWKQERNELQQNRAEQSCLSTSARPSEELPYGSHAAWSGTAEKCRYLK